MLPSLCHCRVGIIGGHICLKVQHQARSHLHPGWSGKISWLVRKNILAGQEKSGAIRHLLPIPFSTLVCVVQPEVVLKVKVFPLHLILLLPDLPLLPKIGFNFSSLPGLRSSAVWPLCVSSLLPRASTVFFLLLHLLPSFSPPPWRCHIPHAWKLKHLLLRGEMLYSLLKPIPSLQS